VSKALQGSRCMSGHWSKNTFVFLEEDGLVSYGLCCCCLFVCFVVVVVLLLFTSSFLVFIFHLFIYLFILGGGAEFFSHINCTDHNDRVALFSPLSKGRNSSITTALTRVNTSFFPLSLTFWRLFFLSHQFCSVALVKRGLFLYYKKQNTHNSFSL